jgi:hypothetical protein
MKKLEVVGGFVSDVDIDIWSFLSPKAWCLPAGRIQISFSPPKENSTHCTYISAQWAEEKPTQK